MQLHRGNLFLIGLPGSGKSTLGRLLSRRLEKTFLDADVELERRLGVSVPVIFEIEGEAGFRERERVMLADLVQRTNVLLATGGGAVLNPLNREGLKQNGTVLYLHAMPQTVYERTRRGKHRPLLNTPDPLARLNELYTIRNPLYREIADIVVESDRDQVSRLAQRLELQFRSSVGA
jgi:shikimate kinase